MVRIHCSNQVRCAHTSYGIVLSKQSINDRMFLPRGTRTYVVGGGVTLQSSSGRPFQLTRHLFVSISAQRARSSVGRLVGRSSLLLSDYNNNKTNTFLPLSLSYSLAHSLTQKCPCFLLLCLFVFFCLSPFFLPTATAQRMERERDE